MEKQAVARAFIVSDPSGDAGGVVVFADSPGKAKALGLTEHLTFAERAVKRAPELDKYRDQGGPTRQQLFEHHDWWFPCAECEKPTTSFDGTWQGTGAVCEECTRDQTAPDLLEVLGKLVSDLDCLIANSDGVYGLHRNGDGAPWGELTAGGQFESWLTSLEVARTTLAQAKGETAPATERE